MTGKVINHRQARLIAYLYSKDFTLDERATNQQNGNAVILHNGIVRVKIAKKGA